MELKPKYYSLKTGEASAKNKLNSIDRALISANIGDYNLIKISSILPKECKYKQNIPKKPAGKLVPTVISRSTSSKKNQVISASIVVGETKNNLKVIAEANGPTEKNKTEKKAKKRAKTMIKDRNLEFKDIKIKSTQKEVKNTSTVVAAAITGGYNF
ncbi:hypothetical protein C9439_06255 [archaeon SCG-AAA382B04]|nr:hypothetical protein C9439_06255 [archaeon SCG-AAA382B04]